MCTTSGITASRASDHLTNETRLILMKVGEKFGNRAEREASPRGGWLHHPPLHRQTSCRSFVPFATVSVLAVSTKTSIPQTDLRLKVLVRFLRSDQITTIGLSPSLSSPLYRAASASPHLSRTPRERLCGPGSPSLDCRSAVGSPNSSLFQRQLRLRASIKAIRREFVTPYGRSKRPPPCLFSRPWSEPIFSAYSWPGDVYVTLVVHAGGELGRSIDRPRGNRRGKGIAPTGKDRQANHPTNPQPLRTPHHSTFSTK